MEYLCSEGGADVTARDNIFSVPSLMYGLPLARCFVLYGITARITIAYLQMSTVCNL